MNKEQSFKRDTYKIVNVVVVVFFLFFAYSLNILFRINLRKNMLRKSHYYICNVFENVTRWIQKETYDLCKLKQCEPVQWFV